MSNIPLEFEGGRKLEIEVFQLAAMEALCKGGEPKSMSVVYHSFPTSN